ncbi:hypothetical protein [Qipengyuania qiaonensis]|nr:hypothetical protein [Qipengyuania qiaonensis]
MEFDTGKAGVRGEAQNSFRQPDDDDCGDAGTPGMAPLPRNWD